ncbi:MAG: ExbD/TolR family protein [Desulfovibrio sp.]|jgi:biopolymer transport protein TolR|nr:ExbD/TolR family protein [Desulfovibrio sp.]
MAASLGNNGFVADINVTPFVDVMLVLLIIFMVTAPMMTEGLDVNLPKTEAVESLPTDPDNVVLTIRKDGAIYLNEFSATMDTLATQLETVVKIPSRRLFLQADKEVPYGVVVGVMGKIKAAGIAEMGIVAERLDDEEGQGANPGAGNVKPKADQAPVPRSGAGRRLP